MAWLASLAGGALSGAGQKEAGNKANKQASAERSKYYDEAKKAYAPYAGSGISAQQVLNQLLGLEGYRTKEETAYSDYLKTAPSGVDLSQFNAKGLEGLFDKQEKYSTMGDLFGGVTKYYTKKNSKKAARAEAAAASNRAAWQAKANKLKAASEASLSNYDQKTAVQGILERTPGYQFRYGLGETAVNNNLAGRNMSQSGAALKELTRYGQDYGSKEYQNALANYGAAANKGFDANTALANMAVGQGSNLASLALNKGNINADYYSTLNNAAQSGLSNYMIERNRSSYGNAWTSGNTGNNVDYEDFSGGIDSDTGSNY